MQAAALDANQTLVFVQYLHNLTHQQLLNNNNNNSLNLMSTYWL